MWKIAYNLLIHISLPFFIFYAFTRPKIRQNLFERFSSTTKGLGLKDTIWIHAASIGEAKIAENLIRYMQRCTGVYDFLVTTNTYYAKNLLAGRAGAGIYVCSLPFDLSYCVTHFINRSAVKALLIIETEIWPNLIWEASKKRIPVLILNGRISDNTLSMYRRFFFFMRHVLSKIDLVLAQSEEHRDRFISIGMDPRKVMNVGNLKYYREEHTAANVGPKDNIVTFGSIKEKELEIILKVINMLRKSFPEFVIFVAPRELHLVNEIENRLSAYMTVMRYSAYRQSRREGIAAVVVDTVGDLLDIYRKSRVAFVGGSLAPYGGQNLLEPLFFGTPVLFGPFIENFKDIAQTVMAHQAGIMVNNGEELYEKIETLLHDDRLSGRMGIAGLGIIAGQDEAMERTANLIMETMSRTEER